MKKINIAEILSNQQNTFYNNLPVLIKRIILSFLSSLMHIKQINNFIEVNSKKYGIDFIDELLETLDISYSVSAKDKLKIPSEGKLFIVSNHPLGGIDGLLLIKLISEVRSDVKIIVNDLLMNIDNLSNNFIPFDLFSNKSQRENIEQIYKSLTNNNAVIIFPSGEVSRLGLSGIKDSKWKKSVIQLSKKFKVPVLPVYVNARNSMLFYFISIVNKTFSIFFLPRELFNKKGKTFQIIIGHHIPSEAFENRYHKIEYQIKLLRKHVELIGKGKKGIFASEKNVIHPLPSKLLKHQINKCKVLGLTSDKKKIFLVDSITAPEVLKEIARLREITFRKVSEGTGKKMDVDKYDEYYKHIVLWDEEELEIVGAYRIGIGRTIMPTLGVNGFYTSELFKHSPEMESILLQSAELGRSFVQSKYWNTSALDYLWQGLGVFLRDNPNIKYTFGGVSLSKTYSETAKNHIIFFYNKWFPDRSKLSAAKNKFIMLENEKQELKNIYSSEEYKIDFSTLKEILKNLGYTIPVLYKQYSELCEPDGIKFIDFCIDPDFNDCVDALIIVEVEKIKTAKKERYIYNNKNVVSSISEIKIINT
jgi:putative hemolysin